MVDWHENYYNGIKGIYFRCILRKIISIGKLKSKGIRILDFGCGIGQLKKILGDKVINYDKVKDLSGIRNWRKADFDVVVSNEVFHYMNEKELRQFINELYKKNNRLKLIIGLSRMNLLTKVGMIVTGKTDAHEGKLLDKNQVMKILKEKMKVIRNTSVFQMCDIYVMQFKNSTN